MVWVCLSIVGWAVLAGIGYSVYTVGGDIIAGRQAPDAAPPAVNTAGPTDREIREAQEITPAAGGESPAR